MAWIELHQSLPTHRKTMALCDALNIEPAHAVGHLTCFWLWALDNAPDGNLAGVSPRTIARAAMWKKSPEVLFDALVLAGFIDLEEGSHVIHDWYDFAGKLSDQRELRRASNREAQARRRQRLRGDDNPDPGGGRNGHVSMTGQHGQHVVSADKADSQQSTVPNRTVPNRTVEDHYPPAPNGAAPRGNFRVQSVIDAFRETGYEPSMGPRDYAAIKRSTAPPGLIVEAFMAVMDREYGDDFMRKRLSVHEAIDWVPGYCEHRLANSPSHVGEMERLRALGLNIDAPPPPVAEAQDADERCPECLWFNSHSGKCSKARLSA